MNKLNEVMYLINSFLQKFLHLKLNFKKCKIIEMRNRSNHFDFLGYRIFKYRRYIINRVIGNAKQSKNYKSLNSYLGMLRHANEFNIRKKLCEHKNHDSEYTKIKRSMSAFYL